MAHASVTSLMRTIESLLTSNSPMQSLICDHREELCALREKATVSQQHNRKEILPGLLRSTIKTDDTVKTRGEAELVDMLQKSLKRKRYLIVLDDIWSCKAWDGVRRCFPTEDNAGSRILLTTRNDEVAHDAAFSNEALSSEFETIGKKIVEKCHGLPLTIVVVAGLLKSKRAIEDWGSVAKDFMSFITNDPDEQCSHVLGLSYNHLTSNLKACLLHFGIFREDSEIPAKKLMRTWMAEGFLKLETDLEGEAEKCLQDLVDRCLVIVSKKSIDGTKIRSCKVHDLIYDLCLNFKGKTAIPPEIFRLWNLQTFIVQGSPPVTCPEEIWGLMQLSHLKLPKFYLPNPPSISADKGSHMGFSNIQTISYLSLDCCTNEVIMGIQNVKELGISAYEIDSDGLLNNLVHLQQLETLSLTYCFSGLLPASAKSFPATLKKLKLEATYLHWSYLDIIAELPNLEVLKLMVDACCGEKWYPNVRGFTRLKDLLIEYNDVKYWKATNDNFPVLKRLELKECTNLKEIPIEFADIQTLQLIELTMFLPKLGESAARIQKEQEELGNDPVNVRISDPYVRRYDDDDEFDDDDDDE
ncbi:hypothetical protein BC332_17935 [Capsicum chinense]|nr:hypothetical protein BC332_17935 [Capsicum chinense]